MTISRLFVAIFLFFSFVGNSQTLKWKPITQQTKPWSRWWWEGNAVNPKDLTFNMENYQKVGLGGLEITPIYGVKGAESQFVDFLSPKWVSLFKHTLNEGTRLGLGIDLANASGWPFGGRWVEPEDACRYVAHKVYNLKEGEKLAEAITFQQQAMIRFVLPKNVEPKDLKQPIGKNDNLQELAIDQVKFDKILPLETLMAYSDTGEKVNLTDKVGSDGQLNWTATRGNWSLYAIFSGWHGKMVERAGPGGEGDVIDHFSDKAINNYLKEFDKAFAGTDVSSMRAFFNDSYEVDDAKGQSDWTPELFNEFQKRRGYDLRNYLPNLFSKEKTELNSRVLCDYRTTISDLILEKYTSAWAKWGHSRGKIVRNQAHGSPGNTLDLYSMVDIPEIEGTDLLRIKFASSASNVMNKKLTSSESATWDNEHFLSNLGDVKKDLDLFFLGGVNHVFYHGTNYSPQNEPFPGWLFYAATHFTPHNPFWKHFGALNQYVARTQTFLQDTKPDNDILLYFPIYDRFAEQTPKGLLQHFDGVTPEFNNTDFKTVAQNMIDKSYSFDYVSDRQIANLNVKNQSITNGATAWKTILLSENETLPLETFEKLVQLAKEGATIVIHNKLPQDVPGLGNLEERQAKFKALIAQLNFTKNAGVSQANIGKGRFILGENLGEILAAAKVQRETMIDKGLSNIRKINANGKTYFINNTTSKSFDGWVKIETPFQSVALYNPMTEKLGLAKYNAKTNEVYVQLMAGESIILETHNDVVKAEKYPYFKSIAKAQELTGNWKVTFTEGGEVLPKAIETKSLNSWTNFEGEDYKNFSGIATYSHDFKLANASKSGYWLDLGKIAESAKVSVNGKALGTLLGPSYQVFIPANVLKSQNTLTVEVANSMANRVIALEKKGVIWQKFYNINVSARLKENLGKDGYFTTKNWTPKDSGILGKVTLTAVEVLK
ncbi:alpha-L-rhamnosidase-like protein [Arcicella aurantiaca]|uniref:Alpha-L-rhamnosidase-like protein n=1 Tax=Arcicella aurantiaca TaxID=591202 RepID=A0A316DGT1_9BACT|nr:glycosyl hydrolase [Arcicella aurantiaca]PWK16828.1 alpha-L-rhamnosidase-like protein [Arcicella aurantiaca]